MMLLSLLLKGWLIGFLMAIPVGPIGMLCIRHSLIRGTLYGLVAGLGAALADMVYGILAGFGVTIICDILTSYQMTCQMLGALFLCYLGIKMLITPPRAKSEEIMIPTSLLRIFLITFILTLTNPLTLIGFMGIYAAFGIGLMDHTFLSFCMVAGGIFIGSTTWWFILSASSSLIGRKLNLHSTHLINRISGTAFLAFGALIALSAIGN
ncbi:MAG: LysE family translocator [Parachlamydiaceae bacterium]|nr:LysE family translocator [Parachlamydiaceae bacterium]